MTRAFIAGSGAGDQNPVAFAANAHVDLARIPPFAEGNGRTCRLVVNALLLENHYSPALCSLPARNAYLSALEQAQVDRDPAPFITVTATVTQLMLDRWLHLLDQHAEANAMRSQVSEPNTHVSGGTRTAGARANQRTAGLAQDVRR